MNIQDLRLIRLAKLDGLGAVRSLSYIDKRTLLVGSASRFLRRIQQRGGELHERARFEHRWGIRSAAASPDGEHVAAGDAYSGLVLLNRRLKVLDQHADRRDLAVFTSLDFHPSAPLLLATVESEEEGSSVDLFEVEGGQLRRWRSIPIAARVARFTGAGNTIIAAGHRLLRIALDGTVVDEASCGKVPLDLALGRDDRTAAVASADPARRSGEVLLFSLEPRMRRVARREHPSFITSIDIGPAGHLLIGTDVTTAGDGDGAVEVLHPRGAKLKQLAGLSLPGEVVRVRVSPDGAQLAAATGRGKLCLIEGSRGR